LKYSLSTILLLVVIVAISLGWLVEHFDHRRKDIVGTWHYPTPRINVYSEAQGYSSTFEIRSDGTFQKTQLRGTASSIYEGRYAPNDDGTVTFRIVKRTRNTKDGRPLPANATRITEFNESFNAEFRCSCGIDKTGYLIIADGYGLNPFGHETGIRWEIYMPTTAR